MRESFLSVVVPVRNARAELPGLLAALAEQTLPASSSELLFVDDGSIDGSASWLLEHMPHNARLLHSPARANPYAARNAGVRAARGRFLAFTDADCRPAPDWLEQGIRALESARRVAGRIVVDASSKNLVEELDRRRFLRQERFVRESFAATANMFVRREVFDDVGLFDERLVSGGDHEFGVRAAHAGLAISYAPWAVVHHRARRHFGELLKKAHRVGVGFGQSLRHHPARLRGCERIVDRLALIGVAAQLADTPLERRGALVAGHAVLALGTAVGCARGYWQGDGL